MYYNDLLKKKLFLFLTSAYQNYKNISKKLKKLFKFFKNTYLTALQNILLISHVMRATIKV
jgi:hypothetical protein